MRVYFHTLGCKVNQYETQSMRELFERLGHTASDSAAEADIIVINSCTVTAESDRKTRQLLHRCRRECPNGVIVLTGCMVQAFPEDCAALADADIVAGNKDTSRIVKLALGFDHSQGRIIEISAHEKGEKFSSAAVSEFSERTRAFMKIQDGCDRFCTYCIIPKARGRVRSRSLSEIRAEAQRLADNGFCEIVLVGINLSAYGTGEDISLCDAVETVCSVDGIRRVRLGSLEPDHITDEMLLRLRAEEKFCPQFHLSLQSGCDETLKRMNRHYDTAFYTDLITRIRSIFEDAAITTDIMVGFAGETSQEFEESLAFAKRTGFARAHIFAYSRRAGTVAAALPDQVTQREKENRSRRMIAVCDESEERFLEKMCGKVQTVLFEKKGNGFCEGYTANYTRVRVETDAELTGQLLPVRLISVQGKLCIGKLI